MDSLYAWWTGVPTKNPTVKSDDETLKESGDDATRRRSPNPMVPALHEHFEKKFTAKIASCTVNFDNVQERCAFKKYLRRVMLSATKADKTSPQGRRLVVHVFDILVAHRGFLCQDPTMLESILKTSNSYIFPVNKQNYVDLRLHQRLLRDAAAHSKTT